MIRWVYESVSRSSLLSSVIVATDDARIQRAVESFGGQAVLTSPDHQSGTDRVAEVAASIDADVFVNIQGDEPMMPASTIDAVCQPFVSDPNLQVCTARIGLDPHTAESPHVVKVVVDLQDKALYFSRSLIPYPRRQPASYFKHIGIYAYTRSFLSCLGRLRDSSLERSESLEQLRFLENGIAIRVVEIFEDSIGIDTPEDVERVRPLLENKRLWPDESSKGVTE